MTRKKERKNKKRKKKESKVLVLGWPIFRREKERFPLGGEGLPRDRRREERACIMGRKDRKERKKLGEKERT